LHGRGDHAAYVTAPRGIYSIFRLGDMEIDILNRCGRAGDTELHLTPVEHSLLYLLAAMRNRSPLTRSRLSLGADHVAESNVVNRRISATCASTCRTIHGGRDTWSRSLAADIDSCPVLPAQNRRALLAESASDTRIPSGMTELHDFRPRGHE
jgi:hypothetical protein